MQATTCVNQLMASPEKKEILCCIQSTPDSNQPHTLPTPQAIELLWLKKLTWFSTLQPQRTEQGFTHRDGKRTKGVWMTPKSWSAVLRPRSSPATRAGKVERGVLKRVENVEQSCRISGNVLRLHFSYMTTKDSLCVW
ncbi:hypothetical protein Fcan01_21317 [Folsomia candida]|uniref:Uncharacterized protein n=1 Tax=Folsomia candida TaxID=158441 RepID=A0A226DGR0_FOLCA|nr:hypothetical protein Fcan01_21317 [Folsomia candida]